MRARKIPSVADVISATVTATGVDFAEMRSRRRHPDTVAARQIATLIARRRAHASFPDIAEAFGRARGSNTTDMERCLKAMDRDAVDERCNDFARLVNAVNDIISDRAELRDITREGITP